MLWDPGRFLYEIQLNSSVNKMSVDNLATVMGVNLIRPRVEDPAVIMRGKRDPGVISYPGGYFNFEASTASEFKIFCAGAERKAEMCWGPGQSPAECLLGCKCVCGDKNPLRN